MGSSNLLLNLDDFVRVTQETGEDIVGRYDGVDYTFPHGHAVDVHKAVATHIFGFGLPAESNDPRVQDKAAALTRLGWLRFSEERKGALARLAKVRFEDIPPFPTVLKLRHAEEDSGLTQVEIPNTASRVPSSPPLGSGVSSSSGDPADPKRATLTLPKAKA